MELLYTSVVTERLTYKLLRWHKNATVCRKGRRIASEASVYIVGEIVTGSRMKWISKLLREPGNNWERRKEGVGVRWFYERLCYITIGGTKGNCFSPQSSSALGDEEKKRQRNPTQTPQNSPEGYVRECFQRKFMVVCGARNGPIFLLHLVTTIDSTSPYRHFKLDNDNNLQCQPPSQIQTALHSLHANQPPCTLSLSLSLSAPLVGRVFPMWAADCWILWKPHTQKWTRAS